MKFHTVNAQGKFWTQRVTDKDTTHHKNVIDEGRIIYSQLDGKLYYGQESDWTIVMGENDFITTGTTMMFGYVPLPDGWNINLQKNDITVMITLDSDDIGQNSGSWTISGIQTSGDHNHSGETSIEDETIKLGESDIRAPFASWPSHTHTIPSDGTHIHGFNINWRPSYIKFLEATFG